MSRSTGEPGCVRSFLSRFRRRGARAALAGLLLAGGLPGFAPAASAQPALTVDNAQVDEGDSGTRNLSFTVKLAPESDTTVTVEVNTGPADGDITARTDHSRPGGPDYQAVTNRTLTFAPGETEQTVNVLVNGDRTDEPNSERLMLNLSNAVNADIETESAVGFIVDDDPPPRLTIESLTVVEGDAGTTTLTFTAATSVPSGQEVVYHVDVAGVTAEQGEDYRVPHNVNQVNKSLCTGNDGVRSAGMAKALDDQVTRPQQQIISGKRCQTQKTFQVVILGDTLEEPDETFRVNLSRPLNVVLPDAAISGTITDDDGNTAPAFSESGATRSLAETPGGATVQTAADVGQPVVATDADDDELTYNLEGTDAGTFTVDGKTGQIRTRVGESYDREAQAIHAVTVKAADGNGGGATIDVTIEVTNVTERPLAPAGPSVAATAGSATSLDVGWSAPSNTGRPAIASYDLQYRKGASGAWNAGPQDETGTSATLADLDANSQYQVQVRASNADGDGGWSPPGSGRTGNTAPAFAESDATRSLPETVGDATVQAAADIGAPVVATDADDDALNYSLEGADAVRFTVDRETGQIRARVGESYDREAHANHAVTVKAADGNGGSATIAVTIDVLNVTETPQGPAAPSVSSTAGNTTSLDVGWSAPSNTGRPAIASYDLQYRKGTSGAWTAGPQDETGTSATIADLDAGSQYQVQVRASNADGDGDWSPAGSGRTGNATPEPGPQPQPQPEPEPVSALPFLTRLLDALFR